MVSAQTTRRTSPRKPTGAIGFRPLTLDQLAELLPTSPGKRPRVDRLARDDRVYRWAIRHAYAARSRGFRTTLAQSAKGAGYPVSGDRDDDVARFGNNIRRALDSLQLAGVLRWRPLRRPDGRYWCLWVELLPVDPDAGERAPWRASGGCYGRRELGPGERAAPRRPSSARRVYFIRPKCHLPSSTPSGYIRKRKSARARTRARAHPGGFGVSATGCSGSESGRAGRQPGLDGAARARSTLVATFERAFRAPARFDSARWGPRLDRALARLDRYANFGRGRDGAGLDFAVRMIDASAEAIRAPAGWWEEPPGSLAYFVPIIEATSKDWRRAHRPRLRAERQETRRRGPRRDRKGGTDAEST